MKDPFFPPIPALSHVVQPWADRLSLPMLPQHVHEVLGAALFYTFVQVVVSPVVSKALFPGKYPTSRSKKANWDIHVVSIVQSLLVCFLGLWVIFADGNRKSMGWQERVWGYTGASGLVQALAAGFFLWDLVVCLIYFDIFGFGFLAHAISALAVYLFGFRPFLNYYGSVFILYELSTPFLNIHWFFDKLGMTGSRAQFVNGVLLIVTFFSCRLVWGSIQSARVYWDIWRAFRAGKIAGVYEATAPFEVGTLPLWLVAATVVSNLTLNVLNFHWFGKMINALRKRFDPEQGEEVPAGKLSKDMQYAGESSGVEVVKSEKQGATTKRG